MYQLPSKVSYFKKIRTKKVPPDIGYIFHGIGIAGSPVNSPDYFSRFSIKVKEVKTTKRKVTGVIVPSDWTDDGKVTRIAIFTTDENEYLIDLTTKGKELMQQINAKVEISGDVKPRQIHGRQTIAISSYRLLDENRNGF